MPEGIELPVITVDPTYSHAVILGDFSIYSKLSIACVWSTLVGTDLQLTLQLQQKNNAAIPADDIVDLVKEITTASGSVTFEHTDFMSSQLILKIVASNVESGNLQLYIITKF